MYASEHLRAVSLHKADLPRFFAGWYTLRAASGLGGKHTSIPRHTRAYALSNALSLALNPLLDARELGQPPSA